MLSKVENRYSWQDCLFIGAPVFFTSMAITMIYVARQHARKGNLDKAQTAIQVGVAALALGIFGMFYETYRTYDALSNPPSIHPIPEENVPPLLRGKIF